MEPEETTAAGEAEGEADGEAVLMEEDLIQQSLADSSAGRYNPWLLTASCMLDAHLRSPPKDLQCLQLSHQQLQTTGDTSESAEGRMRCSSAWRRHWAAAPTCGRKPHFFNLLHTGFKWN